MASDLSTFAELPDGRLDINVLDGTCDHSEAGRVDTYIAGEIKVWFLDRLNKHNIPVGDIAAASLTVTMKNTMPLPNKMGITFDWNCDATIARV